MRADPDPLTPFDWRLTDLRAGAVTATVDPSSRGFDGHFPGRPIVPGVCLVDLVRRAAVALGIAIGEEPLVIERASFVDPVVPGDVLDVSVTAGDGPIVGVVRTGRGVACRVRFGATA